MITWPVCALILGLALVAALWDGFRRYADARGMAAWVEAEGKRRDAALDKRLADHAEYVDTLKRGVNAYVEQTTAKIQALESGMTVRTMRAG